MAAERRPCFIVFTQTDGEYPVGGLIFDAQGDLFGTTTNGGAYGYGTVFELIPNSGGSWTEQVLHSFTNSSGDGSNPEAGLVMDNAGNLYGTTEAGGNGPYDGIVFELKHSGSSWTESVLYVHSGCRIRFHEVEADSAGAHRVGGFPRCGTTGESRQ